MSRVVSTALFTLGWICFPVWFAASGQEAPRPPAYMLQDPAPLALEPSLGPIGNQVGERSVTKPAVPLSIEGGGLEPSDAITQPAPIPSAATQNATPAEPVGDDGVETEVITERYPNREVRIERHVAQDTARNFVSHGLWTMWSPQGAMVAKGRQVWGKRQGEWFRLYSVKNNSDLAGKLAREFALPFSGTANFVDGKIHGTWKIVDARQRDIRSWEFEFGALHGKAITWYPNGRKKSETTFENGIVIGYLMKWDSNGRIVARVQYLDGRSLVPYVKKYPTGEKLYEGQHLSPRQSYKSTIDFWNGIAKVKLANNKGKPKRHGKWSEWHKNGGLKFQGEFDRDLPVGIHTWWYSNGQKKATGQFVNGKEHGHWILWHANGLRHLEGDFRSGIQNGEWLRWDEKGKLTEKQQHHLSPASPQTPKPLLTNHYRIRKLSRIDGYANRQLDIPHPPFVSRRPPQSTTQKTRSGARTARSYSRRQVAPRPFSKRTQQRSWKNRRSR